MEFLDIFCPIIFAKMSKNLIHAAKKNVPSKQLKKFFLRKISIILCFLLLQRLKIFKGYEINLQSYHFQTLNFEIQRKSKIFDKKKRHIWQKHSKFKILAQKMSKNLIQALLKSVPRKPLKIAKMSKNLMSKNSIKNCS